MKINIHETLMNLNRGRISVDQAHDEIESAMCEANVQPQLYEVTELIIDAVNIDGAHHKQWYLEQIAVKLGIELPEHEKGIIP